MKLSFGTIAFVVALLQMAAFAVDASTEQYLRGRELEEEDAGDDYQDDDVYYVNATSTIQGKTKDYVVYHAQSSYSSVPSEWDRDQWVFFALAMFVFGGLSSICCLVFVFPCCCPSTMRTAYARMIAPSLEDSKKVRLIKK